ncbi:MULTISPECIES: hypothetical protein [unclassified Bartonella]|uniref:hypothetical protein n=1 Tax=unclassified Bartonella TaxID=2645622 RepID=UPI0035D00917
MSQTHYSDILLKRETFKQLGQLDRIALQSALVQRLHRCSFEELGKHYPIAVLMQLDQLDPIVL